MGMCLLAVRPLSYFKDLGNFFAHIDVPFEFSHDSCARRRGDPEFKKEVRLRMERLLEQRVMGKDYSAFVNSKSERENSRWLQIAIDQSGSG
jgi:hypothetical protein